MKNCCLSQELRQQKIVNQLINHQLQEDRKSARRELRCVLLGTPGSGKSTFLKQLKIVYGEGYSQDERQKVKKFVYRNVLQSMQELCRAMISLNIKYTNPGACEPLANIILNLDGDETTKLDKRCTEAIKTLWNDMGIQKCWLRRNQYLIQDTAKYFFEDIERIAAFEYIPNEQDILRVHVPTNGIDEFRFDLDHISYRMVDVGGQQNDIRKWLHEFEDDFSIFFFVPMNEFDQGIEENCGLQAEEVDSLFKSRETYSWFREGTIGNGLEESKELFKTIVESPWFNRGFNRVPIILIFSKADLFEVKLESSNLGTYFSDFPNVSDADSNAAKEVISSMFIDTRSNRHEYIYHHSMCLTDTYGFEFVFNQMINAMIRTIMRLTNELFM